MIAFNSPRRLARPLLGHAALGPLARQQAARRLRRAPRARASRQLRRHPPGPDAGDVPAVLRADAGRLGHRRGALGGGDVLVRAAGAHADLHPRSGGSSSPISRSASASSCSRAGYGTGLKGVDQRRRWRSRPGSAMSETHDDSDGAGRGYDAALLRRLLGYLRPYRVAGRWRAVLLLMAQSPAGAHRSAAHPARARRGRAQARPRPARPAGGPVPRDAAARFRGGVRRHAAHHLHRPAGDVRSPDADLRAPAAAQHQLLRPQSRSAG